MSVGEAPSDPALFGRLKPRPASWAAICADVPEAQPLAPMAAPPPVSPPLHLYRHPRYRGQLIGCCVGESGSAMLETTCRTPLGTPLDPVVPLSGTPTFSALGVYWSARDYSRRKGRPIFGEGAYVTDALAAVCEAGVALYDAWPSTEANYRAYRDDSPPASFTRAPKLRPAGEARRLPTANAVLEYLGAGYSVWFGGPWRGGTRTDARGFFRWRGVATGGHAVELLGYDVPGDRLWIGNSWDNARWGIQPGDPALPRGYGFCPLSEFRKDLTDGNLAEGEVEAVVICEVDWTAPAPKPTPEPTPTPPTDMKVDTVAVINGKLHRLRIDPI
jgi:hypothetical protein